MFFVPALRSTVRAAPVAARSLHVSAASMLPKSTKADQADKEPRKPSAYNLFVKNLYPVVKRDNPDLPPKELLKEVARHWRESPENPKNGH